MTSRIRTLRYARPLLCAVVSSVVATTGLLAFAQPAAATVSYATIERSSWAYIDSRTPDQSHLNPTGDAPVGALRDARYRSFFTFDVSRFLGTTVSSVTLAATETRARDCVDRKVELWSTGPVGPRTTWRHPPAQVQLIDTAGYIAGSACPAVRVEWDATAAVQQAVAAGSSSLTLELRIPAADEGNAGLGRYFDNDVSMTVSYNTPPGVPTELDIDQRGCTTQQPYLWEGTGARTPMLSARVTDPDEGQSVSAEFAVWPVDHPDQRTTLGVITGLPSGTVVRERMPAGLIADGVAYGFSARSVDDEGAYSAWGPSCYFQTDFTAPAIAPTVSSTDYPSDGAVHGGQGIPGRFTFSANGVSDVVGFRYGWLGGTGADASSYVPADQPGGSATVMTAPVLGLYNVLYVSSVDSAGNPSTSTSYEVITRMTTPVITGVGVARLGRPFTITLGPGNLPPGYDSIVSYTYTVNGGEAQTVPAGADGTASATFVLTGSSAVSVRSMSGNGWVSTPAEQMFYPDDSPSVSSDVYPENGTGGGPGQTGTFTFGLNQEGGTVVYYSFDGGSTFQTVPVGPDGAAQVAWTPDAPGDYWLVVYSEMPDGTDSAWAIYALTVDG